MVIAKTICNMCLNACGIDVHLEEGRIVEVKGMREHLFHKLCLKPRGLADWVYSKERIASPLKRVNGDWKEISWDEALDIISEKLAQIKQEYDARALVVYTGEPLISDLVARRLAARFCSLYGTPNYTTVGSICHSAYVIGHSLTCGTPLTPSFTDTKCIMIWGLNSANSDVTSSAAIAAARKKGANLIVIDPRRTPLAKKAEIYAQIKPGTDCALALGLLNVIIDEGLYDKAFVQNRTVGFEQLAEHVKAYPPQKVEGITWVPRNTIAEIARTYARSKPATIAQRVAVEHCANGVQTCRAIATLIALTGNIDIPGGNVYHSRPKQASFKVEARAPLQDSLGIEFPIYTRFIGHPTAISVPAAVIQGRPYPVKTLIVDGADPVMTWPNTAEVREALAKLELLVVIDLFMTETAKLAHIFLPAATFVEGQVFPDYFTTRGLPLVAWGEQVIAPRGSSLPDWKIWVELGCRMGYGDYFPWRNDDELLEYLLQPSGITLTQLKQHRGGIMATSPEKQKYLKEGFNTPSGKVEIYSETMAAHGYPPLPTFELPADSPLGQPDVTGKYPLILTTGARVEAFTHSQYHNLALLRRHCPEPIVEINAQTARSLGMLDGDMVILETPKGSIELKAWVGDDVHPSVLSIQHGWDEANANVLTDNNRDPVSGFPNLRSVPCRVWRRDRR